MESEFGMPGWGPRRFQVQWNFLYRNRATRIAMMTTTATMIQVLPEPSSTGLSLNTAVKVTSSVTIMPSSYPSYPAKVYWIPSAVSLVGFSSGGTMGVS